MQKLQTFHRDHFTVADLEKITRLTRPSLKVTLSRLVVKGVLLRLKRGVYASSAAIVDVPRVANQLYYPSYLSFESMLSRYGILSQIPAMQTFATIKQTKKMILFGTVVEFRQLKEDLFFGYKLENGIYVAKPEKALLDTLYMAVRGKGTLPELRELDLRSIDRKIFRRYAKKFPAYLMPLIKEAEKYFGTAAITLETQERLS